MYVVFTIRQGKILEKKTTKTVLRQIFWAILCPRALIRLQKCPTLSSCRKNLTRRSPMNTGTREIHPTPANCPRLPATAASIPTRTAGSPVPGTPDTSGGSLLGPEKYCGEVCFWEYSGVCFILAWEIYAGETFWVGFFLYKLDCVKIKFVNNSILIIYYLQGSPLM